MPPLTDRKLGAIRYAAQPSVLRKSALIAFVVGILLTAANHLDTLMNQPLTGRLAVKIAFNFFIPFLVSSASATMNRRE